MLCEPTQTWLKLHVYPPTVSLGIYVRDISDRKWIEIERIQAEQDRDRFFNLSLDLLIKQMALLHSQVRRMEATIDGLLDYARIDRMEATIDRVVGTELLAETIDLSSTAIEIAVENVKSAYAD